MFLIANTSLLHLNAIKSKRQRLEWIIESSHDAREGDFIAVWLCRRFFFYFFFLLLWELCSCHDCKWWRSARRKQKWNRERGPGLPQRSVHRQSKCCEAALTDGGFWSKKLVDQDCSRTCVFIGGLIHNSLAASPRPILGLARHVEMTATCFMVFCCFSSSISPATYISWFDLKRSSACFTFPFFANAPNTSASTRTLRSHLPVCIGPFGVTRCHHRCVLTEKPPWELQSRARKEKKRV